MAMMAIKECKKCSKSKALTDFYRHANTVDRRQNKCKQCVKEDTANRLANWHLKNKTRRNLAAKARYHKNPAAALARWHKRRAIKIKATPKWLTESHWEQIRDKFKDRQRLSAASGETYHVDHVIPLNSPIVCGLHVPWNLRVLSEAENLRKASKIGEAAAYLATQGR